MKYLITFLLFTFFILSCTQKESNYLVEYKVGYTNDSLNKGNKNVENVLLHITDSGFVFLPKNLFIIDTAQAIDLSNMMASGKRLSFNDFNISNTKLPENNIRIFYKKDPNNYFVRTSVDGLKFKFIDEVPTIKWKFIDEEKIINDYKVKKATTNLFGRNWEAWYTEEIKHSYGPYKFNGLPGLILELHDTDNNFYFELVDLKKDTTNYSKVYADFTKTNSTKAEFINQIKFYKNNPGLYHKDLGIDTIKDNRILKDKLEKLKKINNSIERDLQFNL